VHDNRLTVEGGNRNRKFLDGYLRLSECLHEDISTDDILDAFVPFFVLFIDRGVTYTNLDFFKSLRKFVLAELDVAQVRELR
jgi:hypothetical protein